MDISQIEELNGMLRGARGQGLRADHMLDTFKHPYILFEESFSWPAVHVNGIRFEEARKMLSVLLERAPDYVADCHVLPEARPRKNTNQLQLVRPYEVKNHRFLYMFRITAEYMGGAGENEVLQQPEQGVTPSIQTNRIYYTTRLIPLESIEERRGCITDFHSFKISDAIFLASHANDGVRDRWTTILFDDVDFSAVNERFSSLFSFGARWAPGKLFRPFTIDYLTLCLNLVHPTQSLVEKCLSPFDEIFYRFLESGEGFLVDEATVAFWKKYYEVWQYEPCLSRSGNPHWRWTGLPGVASLP